MTSVIENWDFDFSSILPNFPGKSCIKITVYRSASKLIARSRSRRGSSGDEESDTDTSTWEGMATDRDVLCLHTREGSACLPSNIVECSAWRLRGQGTPCGFPPAFQAAHLFYATLNITTFLG